ncbi:MAG: type II CRISPR RNA-guided endonuclease Cas9, partial [Bacteroidales bacterium]|nr:type II CRISPR RNA-guided endonuclease Cas9 [Bacteroidales bacterium]
IVTRTTNHYTVTKGGRREVRKQATYAIRQSLHKDTVWGLVNLQQKEQMSLKDAIKELRTFLSARIDDPQLRPKSQIVCKPLRRRISQLIAAGKTDKEILALLDAEADVWSEEIKGGKVSVYTWSKDKSAQTYATRFLSSLSDLFDKLTDEEKVKDKIASITDTGIQKILLNHLAQWQGGAATAFSPDGIKWMNENIQTLNGGKPHKPIYKVRRTETSPLGKQQVGTNGNRNCKFVEAAKGTNLFFAIYSDGKGGRIGFTVPLRSVISRKLQKLPIVPEIDENGNKLLFTLSPNDLVYVPQNGETTINDIGRIYKFVSCSKKQAMFIPNTVAKAIVDKSEFGSHNKIEVIDGVSIKNVCLPVEIDRLGNVTLKKIGEDD